jgi:predicted N-formylglutamate amidohydrolase
MPVLLFTCEHGGNRIPRRWATLFRTQKRRLETHEGLDIGAAAMAAILSRQLEAPLLMATTSRLVVDLNRSIGNKTLFSNITGALSEEERRTILEQEYLPHRTAVERAVAMATAKRISVVHIGVHSFTPVLHGVRRNADVGLLYDPRRPGEKALVNRWLAAFGDVDAAVRVRRNYPYRGTGDGLTRSLRERHPPAAYVGIELEVNQGLLGNKAGIVKMARLVGEALDRAIRSPGAR